MIFVENRLDSMYKIKVTSGIIGKYMNKIMYVHEIVIGDATDSMIWIRVNHRGVKNGILFDYFLIK